MYTVLHYIVQDPSKLRLSEIESLVMGALDRYAQRGRSSLVVPKPSECEGLASFALDGLKFHNDCVLAIRKLERAAKVPATLRLEPIGGRWSLHHALNDLLAWCDRLAEHIHLTSTMLVNMSDSERRIWDALDGHAYQEKELHHKLHGMTSVVSGAVRQSINRMIKREIPIAHCPRRGYYRPDRPPLDR